MTKQSFVLRPLEWQETEISSSKATWRADIQTKVGCYPLYDITRNGEIYYVLFCPHKRVLDVVFYNLQAAKNAANRDLGYFIEAAIQDVDPKPVKGQTPDCS
jgi:hypothetical protein